MNLGGFNSIGFNGATRIITLVPVAASIDPADIYSDIVARIEAVGSFAFVQIGAWYSKNEFRTPAALIVPGQETAKPTGCAPINYDIDGKYEIQIIVEDEDLQSRIETLRRLAGVVQNRLDQKRLANRTFAPFTRAGDIRLDSRTMHPLGRIFITGTYRYEKSGDYLE